MSPMLLDLIWLNKGTDTGDHWPQNWFYYRVTPVDASGEEAGQEGSNNQVCRVSWPDLQDMTGFDEGEGVVETVANVGLAVAHYDTSDIVRSKLGVDHDKSILIGSRVRP
jgi:hypothetical protein